MNDDEYTTLDVIQRILDSVATLMLFALGAALVAWYFGPWYIITAYLPVFLVLCLAAVYKGIVEEKRKKRRETVQNRAMWNDVMRNPNEGHSVD